MGKSFTSFSALIDSIKQDVGRDANKVARGVANIAFQDLQAAHSSIMDEYYGGYTPVTSYYFYYEKDGQEYRGISHGYRRTKNLKNNSIIPRGVVPSGKHGFKATVEVGSSGMNDYVNQTGRTFPASAVFDMVWNEGIRGLPFGYMGHIENFTINSAPVGVAISGTPDQAMGDFVNRWGFERGPQVADMVAFNI